MRLSTTGRLAAMAGLALGLRILVIALGCLQYDLSLQQWAHLGDGGSYIRYAEFIAGTRTMVDAYDARLFPGMPSLMAVLHWLGAPTWLGGIALGVLAGTLVPVMAARLFRDERIGWLAAVFPPIFLICTAGPASEGPLLALSLCGLLIGTWSRGMGVALLAGVVLGLAATVRPVACFALLGLMAWQLWNRRIVEMIVGAVSGGVVVVLALLMVRWWLGDALHGVRFYADEAYGGDMLTWPMKSLLLTPFYHRVSPAKLVYVWVHVLLVLVGVALLIAQVLKRPREGIGWLALLWLGGNTLFVLCIGERWGLHAFPRFILPALPPLLWAWRGWMRRRLWIWGIVAAVSVLLAVRHAAPRGGL